MLNVAFRCVHSEFLRPSRGRLREAIGGTYFLLNVNSTQHTGPLESQRKIKPAHCVHGGVGVRACTSANAPRIPRAVLVTTMRGNVCDQQRVLPPHVPTCVGDAAVCVGGSSSRICESQRDLVQRSRCTEIKPATLATTKPRGMAVMPPPLRIGIGMCVPCVMFTTTTSTAMARGANGVLEHGL